MQEQNIKDKLWSSSFIRLCLMNLLLFVGFHMLITTFPYFVKNLGGDDAVAGMAAGMFSIAGLITRPISGWILDNKGRRGILLCGLGGMIFFPLAYVFCSAVFTTVFFRLLHGVFWSCSSTAAETNVSDIVPKSRFGQGMGLFGLSAAVSTAIAPSIGLFLMNQFGFRILFFSASAVAVLAALLGGTVKTMPLPADTTRMPFKKSIRTMFHPDALPASLTIFFYLLPYGAINTFISIYATANGIANGGLYFTCLAVMTALMRALTGKIADQRGEAIMVYAGNACMLATLLLLMLFPVRSAYLIAALLNGVAFGSMTPSMQAMAMRIASPERRGAASATYLCAFDLGIGLGGAVAGVLATAFGYNVMFGLMGIFMLCSVITYLCWGSKHPSALVNYRTQK